MWVLLVASSGEPCALRTVTTPMKVTEDGSVVQRLNITVPNSTVAALTISAKNVVVQDVTIFHPSTGKGIEFAHADNLQISRVEVRAYGTTSGPNPCELPNNDCDNIHGSTSTGVAISSVRLEGGSTGIELDACPGAVVSHAAIRNVRGPFPRGQCVQFSQCDDALLENFSCVNEENHSWTEDSISAWRSSNVTIRLGLVDGNNSPTGVGVMFEGSDNVTHGGLLEDVDAVHQGDGCFSGYPAQHLMQRNVRCAHTHCTGWGGRAKPTSGSLGWAAGDEAGVVSHGIVVEDAGYFDLCRSYFFWEQSKGGFLNDTVGASELGSFTPRAVVSVPMCWDAAPTRGLATMGDGAGGELVEGGS